MNKNSVFNADSHPGPDASIPQLQDTIRRLERSERLQHTLFEIANTASCDQDMHDMLERLHGSIGRLMYAKNFFIALYNSDKQTIRYIYIADEQDGQFYPINQEICADKLKNTVTAHLIKHARAVRGDFKEILADLGLRLDKSNGTPAKDFIGVPMLRNGAVMGVLAVQNYENSRRYTSQDEEVLSFVAEHILNAVERKLGHDALEQRVAERTKELALANSLLQQQIRERERAAHLQATLYRIAALSHHQDTQENIYRNIHTAVSELLNARNFVIALLSADGKELEFPYYVDHSGAVLSPRPLSKGMSEYAIAQAKTLLLNQKDIDELIAKGEVDAATYGTPATSWLGAPLLSPDGVMGAIVVQSYQEDMSYTPQDADLLTFVSYQIASTLLRHQQNAALQRLNAQLEQRVQERTQELRRQISVREQAQLQLKHQVMHDPLTGLPNSLYLRQQLEHALGKIHENPGHSFALLYIDIDRFKLFNDNLGHLTGDAVLKAVAARMASCVRAPDILSRISGDEFAILLDSHPATSVATAIAVAQRIQNNLESSISADERSLHVSVSIGIAMGTPEYRSADQILHDADTALYQAKLSGRRRFVLFDQNIQSAAMNVLDLEQQMRLALQEKQFEPWFQPIVRFQDGAITGYEALIRWRHPERGLLGPNDFLPAADATGLIEEIDWHMYELALGAAQNLLTGEQILNLNVSPQHFQSRNFSARLLELLAKSGLALQRLCLEVTESSMLTNPENTSLTLEKLRSAGIRIALDDFGTGYSSLSHVYQFPISTLKIDRSFIAPIGGSQALRSTAIVTAVVNLAKSLNLNVVAEGVETSAQRQILIAMGCTHAQGYLYGRPAPAPAPVPGN